MKKPDKKILKSKRFLDILMSLLILAVSLIPALLSLILIKLEQTLRGRYYDPLFYKEIRMSRGERFYLYKFNIFKYELILKDQEDGIFIHTKDYERNNGVLYIGWILKQIYMDELPQFFNVLIGDMSVVGPRPVNLEVYDKLMSRGTIDKNRVPAGVTGYFQSHKNTKGKTSEDLDRKYADYYLTQKWYKVICFVFFIMFKTVKVILRAQGI